MPQRGPRGGGGELARARAGVAAELFAAPGSPPCSALGAGRVQSQAVVDGSAWPELKGVIQATVRWRRSDSSDLLSGRKGGREGARVTEGHAAVSACTLRAEEKKPSEEGKVYGCVYIQTLVPDPLLPRVRAV
ncbi:hypothetical protein GW7_08675 [Heterocephalus glaber]|uniref:Uncharacterized protein n=1 Tax=Heterocephalus glaber TaxID=10181 RepID=G5BC93_HETGA|nr:hypothetical protein GW7_08675 [Heterocephalus glaber]